VDNNYLDLGMSKSGFIHTLPSGRLTPAGAPEIPLPIQCLILCICSSIGHIHNKHAKVRTVLHPRMKDFHTQCLGSNFMMQMSISVGRVN
jgi:hypothetical protein